MPILLLAADAFNWGMPENVNEFYGSQVDRLNTWLHWFMLVLFVGWGAFMAYCLFAFRARSGHKARYELIKGTFSKYLEAGVAVFEVVLLVGFSLPVWAKFKRDFPKQEESTVVRVVAQQFAWNFHYAGKDGKFGKVASKHISNSNPLGIDPEDASGKDDIVTVNTLRFPVDKPVIARITSKDVIHSFGVPVLRLKQDAVPGMEIPIYFKASRVRPRTVVFTRSATEAQIAAVEAKAKELGFKPERRTVGDVQAWELTGEGPDDLSAIASMENVKDVGEGWDIACSQLCGNSHYRMRAVLLPMKQAGFDAWLDEKHKEIFPEGTPTEGTPAEGAPATPAPTATPAATPATTATPAPAATETH